MFLALLVVTGAGVWAGATYAGTGIGVWVERVCGVMMILAGGSLMLSRDVFDRANTQLTGAGFSLLGVSYLVPFGWFRTATSLVALGVMIVPVIRRRRAAALRPPS